MDLLETLEIEFIGNELNVKCLMLAYSLCM
jgi:hypothetical protein